MPTRAATPRALSAALWREMGGRLAGTVRDGRVPAGLKPAFECASPPLAEVMRDINKYSNNVMAQQLFLTLGLQQRGSGTLEAARERAAPAGGRRASAGGGGQPVIDNGSGLSRDDAHQRGALAQLLQAAWASPLMPELMSLAAGDRRRRHAAARAGAGASGGAPT